MNFRFYWENIIEYFEEDELALETGGYIDEDFTNWDNCPGYDGRL